MVYETQQEILQKIVLPQNKTLRLGKIELSVKHLSLMQDFYTQGVGLEILESGNDSVILWNNEVALIGLYEEKNSSQASKWEAGLYHTALVFETQSQLAYTVQKLFEIYPKFFVGSADHIATQAFYFQDPEGNGLELYYDKPREDWLYENEKPRIGSEYLDTKDFLETYLPLTPASKNIHMGHIHLKVGDISQAQRFYSNILLFDIIEDMGSALFVSRDGYHHHLGMNVWESLGAWKNPWKRLGLKNFELEFLDLSMYETLLESLKKNNILFSPTDFGISLEDPWGNSILIQKA